MTFRGWTTNGGANLQNPSSSLTRVVFNQSGASVTGTYKAYQASASTNATGNNNQRKMVAHTFGGTTTYYQVYESGGDIWLSSSTGGSWANEILVSDGSGNNFNPSVDVYDVGPYNIYVNIAWVNTSNATVYFRQRHWYNGTWSWLNIENVSSGDPGTGWNPSSWTPVIATNYIAYNRYYNGGASGSIVVKDRTNQNVYNNAGSAPSSNQYCKNPSLAYYYPSGHIAYENTSNGAIYYSKVTYLGGYNYSWNALERVSPSAWSNNSNPSLTIVYSGTPAVAWRNNDNVVANGSASCIRMGIVTSGGEWQNAIQSYSYGYITDVRPTLGGKTNSFDMSVVWSNNGTVTRGNYKNYAWSAPTVIGSGANGGTYPNVTARVVDGYSPKVIYRKSNWQLRVLLAEPPEAAVYPGPGPIPIAMSIEPEETPLDYKWERQGLIDFAKALGELETEGQKITTPPAGTFAFKVAGISYRSRAINHLVISDTGGQVSQYRSESFVVTDGAKKLSVVSALSDLNLSVPQELLSQSLEPLVKIVLRDAKTEEIVKTISEIPASELTKTWNDTFDKAEEFQANLSDMEGREVFVEVAMIGSSNRVLPVIVDDYSIVENEPTTPTLKVQNLKEEQETAPNSFILFQNYPNPFNPETEISFGLPEPSQVKITISDMLGRRIVTLTDGNFSAGYHRFTWKAISDAGNRVASGIYFYRITATGESGKQFTKVMKMNVTK